MAVFLFALPGFFIGGKGRNMDTLALQSLIP
jgi:hypothetical protein